jgi:hypothetical protein
VAVSVRDPGTTIAVVVFVIVNRSRARSVLRVGWTIAEILSTQMIVCGLALAPVVMVWRLLLSWTAAAPVARAVVLSAAALPSYVVFSLLLMFVSALVIRVLGWRTPADTEMRIADLEWPLLQWVRYMAAIHLVRVLSGGLMRGTPVWTAYLRLSGARLGRGVYVNSLGLSDYNLLEFGDDVIIGADAHVSGHTVERGVIRTARVRFGNSVTIGVGSIVDIGVVAGDRCQVGALSLVPKHTVLETDTTYFGIPVHAVEPRSRSVLVGQSARAADIPTVSGRPV